MRRLNNGYSRMLGILITGFAAAFCGGSSPAAPSSTTPQSTTPTTSGGGTAAANSCRTGVATYRIVTTSAAVTSTVNGSCTFNATTVEGTCTNQYSDTTGTSFTSVSTTKNATRGEVVDEVAVIPPLTLSSTTTTTTSGGTLPPSTGTATRTFDGQKRILTQVSVSGGQTSTTTYTAWDSAGRPTAATVTSGAPSTAQSFSYDNATRTQTSSNANVTCTQTFDQNGNPAVGTCPGTTAVTTVLTTQQICR